MSPPAHVARSSPSITQSRKCPILGWVILLLLGNKVTMPSASPHTNINVAINNACQEYRYRHVTSADSLWYQLTTSSPIFTQYSTGHHWGNYCLGRPNVNNNTCNGAVALGQGYQQYQHKVNVMGCCYPTAHVTVWVTQLPVIIKGNTAQSLINKKLGNACNNVIWGWGLSQ